jgi:dienelactone hydrolase
MLSTARGRKLFLKLWYPAEPTPTTPELLWDQLRADRHIPLMARMLLAVLRRRTTAHPGAPLAAIEPATSPVLYNHGLVSFASENTSMMENLASHGYIVIAIQHEEQLSELRALNAHQPAPEKQLAQDLTAQMRRSNAAERAPLARRLYEVSYNTNRLVLERAIDTTTVLNNLRSILAAVPGRNARAPEPSQVHLIGFSVGGAVATEVALRDERIATVVNIDGGTYGSIDAARVRAPYLMIYSADNEAINDGLLPKHARCVTAANTSHLNYHDVAGLLPPLRWMRAVGSAEPVSVLQWRNRTVAEFIRDPAIRS